MTPFLSLLSKKTLTAHILDAYFLNALLIVEVSYYLKASCMLRARFILKTMDEMHISNNILDNYKICLA